MSGPEPTWNDPDWPKSFSGWVGLAFAFAFGVGTLVAVAFLIGSVLR